MDHGPQSVPPYAKGEKKKIPRKKVFSLSHPPNRLPEETVARVFLAEAGMELGPTMGASFTVGLAKSGGGVGQGELSPGA